MKSEAKKKVAVFLVAALIATTVPFNFTSVKAQAKNHRKLQNHQKRQVQQKLLQYRNHQLQILQQHSL